MKTDKMLITDTLISQVEDIRKKDLELISTDSFIMWLISNIQNYNERIYVSSNKLDCEGNPLPKNDQNNVVSFFNIINAYAEHNNIEAYEAPNGGTMYKVMYNGYGFEVLRQCSEDIWWLINHVDLPSDDEFIDYEDVKKYYANINEDSYTRIKSKMTKREAENNE